MATPWVAGAAALLLERNPNWTPNEIANRLQTTAAPIDGSATRMGSGRLDIAAAVGCERGASAPEGDSKDKKKVKKGKHGKNGNSSKGRNRR